MPRKKYEEGQMLNSAAKFWHNSISASVPQCLRAAKFTNEESGDRALQMKLRRRCTTCDDGDPRITATSTTKTPPPASVCVTAGDGSATSDLSNSTSSLLKFSPPKLPRNVICVRNSRHQNKDTTINLRRGSHAWILQRRHEWWP